VFSRSLLHCTGSRFTRGKVDGKIVYRNRATYDFTSLEISAEHDLVIDLGIMENSFESLEDRVLRVISRSARVPLESVKPESTFEELGIDSLDKINVLFDLESEFDIKIDDEQAKRATAMSDIINGVRQLTEANKSSPQN
jgi:acyl carrier protein